MITLEFVKQHEHIGRVTPRYSDVLESFGVFLCSVVFWIIWFCENDHRHTLQTVLRLGKCFRRLSAFLSTGVNFTEYNVSLAHHDWPPPSHCLIGTTTVRGVQSRLALLSCSWRHLHVHNNVWVHTRWEMLLCQTLCGSVARLSYCLDLLLNVKAVCLLIICH